MAPALRLTLLGGFTVTLDNQPISGFTSHKAQALLCYLAVTGRAFSRPFLAGLLWPDVPEANARMNLRKELARLNDLLRPYLRIDRESVALDPNANWRLDVQEFEALLDAPPPQPPSIEKLTAAVALYQGDFLEGFYVLNSPALEEWLLRQRGRLRERVLHALQTLAAAYTQQADHNQAITTLQQLLALEPWREEAHSQLMRLYAQNGQRAAALAQYESCRRILRSELDVDPASETVALLAAIQCGELTQAAMQQGELAPLLQASPAQRSGPSIVHKQIATTVEYALVGRDREWQVLHTLWQTQRHPHFIVIDGEAGIGKTRLAEELLLQAEREGAPIARTRSHALQGQLAYSPVTDWLRTPPLQAALAQLADVWLTELVRLLPELLIARPTLPQPQPLQESWQRKRFFDALVHAFTTINAGVGGRLVLVLDDLQWSDADTLAWLQYLVESVDQALLVVGTARTDEIDADHPFHHVRQQLQRYDKLTEFHLTPLNPAATIALAGQVTAQKLASERAALLFQETAGNPLFVIESMRATPTETVVALLPPHPEQSVGRNQMFMPAKMYSVMQTRLAQLSPKTLPLVQVAATIGGAFDVTLLSQVTETNEKAVFLALDELWQRRVIRAVDAAHFDFSHDRIRDVAYAEINPIQRHLLHRNVARALEAMYGENLDTIAGQLAVHWERAGRLEQAIAYAQRAANQARRLFAHREAIYYRQQALHLLRQLPKSTENRQAEIDLLLALGKDRTEAEGKGYPTINEDLLLAHELVQAIGTPVQQAKVLIDLAEYNQVRGKWGATHELASKALVAAATVGDLFLVANARTQIAGTLMRRGNLAEAHTHYEQIRSLLSGNSAPKYVGYLARFAYCLWLLGFPEQAVQQAAKALHLRREYQPEALPIPLHQYSSILVFCRDFAAVDRLSGELVELTTKRNDEFSLHWGKIYRGWLLVQQGNLCDGIQLMRENADELRSRGNYFYECFWRVLLAEAYLLTSDLDAAFREIDNTLTYSYESGDYHLNAQLLKLRGDCLQAANATEAEIEQHYQLAIDTARQQKARSLELRATTSLCRLWQKQGKSSEALICLADIYNCFTEGFDTGDLVEAKALLTELQCLSTTVSAVLSQRSADSHRNEY